MWYFIGGQGEVWRQLGGREETVAVLPGTCVSIPLGVHFQFRNTGAEPLTFVITTIPPWPNMDEAPRVADHWPVG